MTDQLSPEQFRQLFPTLDSLIHLASCSYAPMSNELQTSFETMLEALGSPDTPWPEFEGAIERVREHFAELIQTTDAHVAIVPNASVGAFQAASTIDWRRRTRIVASIDEFPSLAHVWHRQASDVQLIDNRDDIIVTQEFLDAIDENTGLVSVPLVVYRNGVRVPTEELAAVAQKARDVGAVFFVDAYQAAGVLPIDVAELDCDFLVAGSMKYVLGLAGTAYLYARTPDAGQLPKLTGWFGRVNPFAFDPRVCDFPPEARRFENGTPNHSSAFAADAGFRLIRRLDPTAVWRHVSALTDALTTELVTAGFPLTSSLKAERRGTVVAVATNEPARVAARLRNSGIAASPRGNSVRLAFHYFNTFDDVTAVAKSLRE